MFGNPGTVEQGFLDALSDYPQMRVHPDSAGIDCRYGSRWLCACHPKADPGAAAQLAGHRQCSRRLYQASVVMHPLVVIGADAGLKYMNMDAQMAADLVAMMEPVTKWSTMVVDPASLLRTLRRAIKIAATPPMGPVYVCLPADILDAAGGGAGIAHSDPLHPGCPCAGAGPPGRRNAGGCLHADDLCRRWRRLFRRSSGIGPRGEILLGAEVWEADAGELNLPYDHPLYRV